MTSGRPVKRQRHAGNGAALQAAVTGAGCGGKGCGEAASAAVSVLCPLQQEGLLVQSLLPHQQQALWTYVCQCFFYAQDKLAEKLLDYFLEAERAAAVTDAFELMLEMPVEVGPHYDLLKQLGFHRAASGWRLTDAQLSLYDRIKSAVRAQYHRHNHQNLSALYLVLVDKLSKQQPLEQRPGGVFLQTSASAATAVFANHRMTTVTGVGAAPAGATAPPAAAAPGASGASGAGVGAGAGAGIGVTTATSLETKRPPAVDCFPSNTIVVSSEALKELVQPSPTASMPPATPTRRPKRGASMSPLAAAAAAQKENSHSPAAAVASEDALPTEDDCEGIDPAPVPVPEASSPAEAAAAAILAMANDENAAAPKPPQSKLERFIAGVDAWVTDAVAEGVKARATVKSLAAAVNTFVTKYRKLPGCHPFLSGLRLAIEKQVGEMYCVSWIVDDELFIQSGDPEFMLDALQLLLLVLQCSVRCMAPSTGAVSTTGYNTSEEQAICTRSWTMHNGWSDFRIKRMLKMLPKASSFTTFAHGSVCGSEQVRYNREGELDNDPKGWRCFIL